MIGTKTSGSPNTEQHSATRAHEPEAEIAVHVWSLPYIERPR